MILMIDNYDSFTFNLVQYFQELKQDVEVFEHDKITLNEIRSKKPQAIVISPGPCTPNEAGISLELVRQLKGEIPILGVCLGHQVIAQAFGAKIVQAHEVMHGKTSLVHHQQSHLFKELNNPLTVTRYHSLVVENSSLSDEFIIDAWTENSEGDIEYIMGFHHQSLPLYGVQFHPEAILTEQGHELLNNFLDLTGLT